MLFEHVTYSDAVTALKALDGDGVFRYCEFKEFSAEGGHVDGLFEGCVFANLDWYWGLFNCATFVKCKFTACTFRGTSFSGSRFVECEFADCRFVADNLNKRCSAEGARVYDSTAVRCHGAEVLFANVAV